MANVFISHRGADSALAERLSLEIQLGGHDVWLDVIEIGIGDQIVKRISDGLAGAKYLVLCYSSLGAESPWMSIEWGGALRWFICGENMDIDANTVRSATSSVGGNATLFRNNKQSVSVFHPPGSEMIEIYRRIKEKFDPVGILNPSRMYREL